jgi:hypothetical protein
MDTATLLRILAGCARREICRYFLPNSCIASTAISMDVLQHYGRSSRPWEVCVRVQAPPHYHIELGCAPPGSLNAVGGHLVVLVEEAFLLDSSLGQVTNSFPEVRVPPVFVGQLLLPGSPLRNEYSFILPSAHLHYSAQFMSVDFRSSPDWGPSPERNRVTAAVIRWIDGYCAVHGIT